MRWVITYFVLHPYQLEALKTAKSFGARHVHPAGVFLGFEYQLDDKKLSELVSGCEAPALITGSGNDTHEQPPAPQRSRSPTPLDEPIFLPNIDLTGGDYDNQGLKDVDFDKCTETCRQLDSCVAFSWVERNGWCWPKHTAGEMVPRQGVMSLIIKR